MRFNKLSILIIVMALMACRGKDRVSVFPPAAIPVRSMTVNADSLQLRPVEGLVCHKGKPFSGVSVTYYSNGQLASQIDYLHGKKHGFYRKWYEDGQLSFESQYVEGKQDGMTYSWWKNGNKRSASTFSKGMPNGKQQQWYVTGVKFKLFNLVNGREEGRQQAWRRNGKLYINYEARNGRIFGLKRANLCYGLDNEVPKYKE